jgi:eukaryotic-like serine/threonine-protein kinase
MSSVNRLQELESQWAALHEQGREATAEELCQDTPELLDELKQKLGSRCRSDSVTGTKGEGINSHDSDLAPARSTPTWPAIPGYTIIDKLGNGGVGIVYKAMDLDLNRVVALKTLRAGHRAEGPALERFHREAQAMAQLDHPHIVPIYGEGTFEGQPYFTMKFMSGGSLAERLDCFQRSRGAAVGLLLKLARAVQYLHDKKILHRDLKPLNILLGEGDEPYVSDFGLAKFLDADLELTHTGEVFGTLPYMAPEQATGQVSKFGPATDVWALGVMLYQLLYGCRPFRGAVREELLQNILTADPEPTEPQAGVDRALQAVVLKCLVKEPTQRFASAGELAEELQRWLNNEKTLTRPASWPQCLGRTARRHPLKVATLALVGLTAVAALLLAYLLDPRRAVREMQQELAEGRAVWVVDPAGKLRWSRWRAGTTGIIEHVPGARTIGLQTHTLSLLEILPDLVQDSYEFRALVRHEDSDQGEVGLFFGLKELPGRSGSVLFFCSFTFDDVQENSAAKVYGGNPASLNLNLYREEDRKRELPPVGLGRRRGGKPMYFKPTLLQGDRAAWHPLLVSVTPEAIQVNWQDTNGIQTRVLTRQDYLQRAQEWFNNRQEVHVPAQEFPPRGGVGLLLLSGEASFKDVEIRPLSVQP